MSNICGAIASGVAFDCEHPLVPGANDRLILFNYSELQDATYTFDAANPLIIDSLSPAQGVLAYAFEGQNNSVEPAQNLVKNRYYVGYNHEITFKVFSAAPDTKKVLQEMAKGRVVAIVQNNWKGDSGEGAFEVYGWETGLEVQELSRTIADAETGGAFNIVLRNNEVSIPGTLPHTLDLGGFTTTLNTINGWLTP